MGAFVSVIGGIGFFLLGMNMMANGLKTMAGDSLRNLLNRFTGGTISAIITGMVITLLIQSSTATSLMTIGFVSAGMLTFVQATGVIFGANLGTTSIGWMVAFIGLKYSISQLALPLVGIGVVLRHFRKRLWAQLGHVLSGLGLIFVGIQFLQDGMSVLNDYIDLSQYADDELTIGTLFLLILIGIVMTIIMQSSSAAIVTTITVLASDVIGLEQAIALVIGQNIGTTATVAFASFGDISVSAKRTALAHILFNVFTGIVAFVSFPWYVAAIQWIAFQFDWTDPAVIVALFHTSFSVLGIFLLAPFIKKFTQGIAWLLPEKKSPITQHLDERIVAIPAVATETAMRALKEAAKQMLTTTIEKFECILSDSSKGNVDVEKYDELLKTIREEMREVQNFVVAIQADSPASKDRYTSLLHALDHMRRLNKLVVRNLNDVKLTNPTERIYPVVVQLEEIILECIEALEENNLDPVVPKVGILPRDCSIFGKRKERESLKDSKREVHVNEAFEYVKLILLVDGILFHLWRMMHHLAEKGVDTYDEIIGGGQEI